MKYTLHQLTEKINETIAREFVQSVWVVAEIGEMNVNARGHCYLELVERNDADDNLLAKMRATIWANQYRLIQSYFQHETGRDLAEGLKVLLRVSVNFHSLYGFSLNVQDIDPAYTIGELAMKRQEIIRRLQEEGVFDMNKETYLSKIPQKIAVISSPTAAGWGDFQNHIENNEYGLQFYLKLFPATMQGEETAKSIVLALEKIYDYIDLFDAVVIIRGGGSQTDLSWFDAYDIAYHITQFPIPVLTGIGHDKDQSISDMVAHTSLKTPTAVADFLIDKGVDILAKLEGMKDDFKRILEDRYQSTCHRIQQFKPQLKLALQQVQSLPKLALQNKSMRFSLLIKNLVPENRQRLQDMANAIVLQAQQKMEDETRKIQQLSEKTDMLHPKNMLKRGFSITSVNGKVVKSAKDIAKGDVMHTHLLDGEVESTVN